MDKAINELFSKNELEKYCHGCYDEHEKEFQYYKELPEFTQKRIYFEYWFLSKMILNEKVTLASTAQECHNIGWTVGDTEIIRLITSITSNGCISIITPTVLRNTGNDSSVLHTDFIYFNNANPTYKVGKISTIEIFKWLKNKNDHEDIGMQVIALSLCLNEILKKILKK